MKPEFVPDRTTSADQVLCLDRKMENYPVKARQAVFAEHFARGCGGIT